MYYKFSINQNNIKKRNLQFERFFSFQYQNDSELLNVHVDSSTPYRNYSLKNYKCTNSESACKIFPFSVFCT